MMEGPMKNAIGTVAQHVDGQISPAVALGALALQMAINYHDVTIVKDGALYQQYKLEGKNFRELHLDVVFETAMAIEQHLLASKNRLSDMILGVVAEAITFATEEGEDEVNG